MPDWSNLANRRTVARLVATTYNRIRMSLSPSPAKPNATAPGAPTDAAPGTAILCFHCALPVSEPNRYCVKVAGRWQPVCCPGCEAVAAAILGYGLEGYYQHRTAPAATAQDDGQSGEFRIYDDPEVQRGFVHTSLALSLIHI